MSLCETMWSWLKRSSMSRLEDLHFLTGDLSAPQAPDELLALAAEHAAGDDFDPSSPKLFPDDVHDFHCLLFARAKTRTINPSRAL